MRHRGVIHIIPDSIDTLIEQFKMEVSPPVTHIAPGKIGEYTPTRPHIPLEEFSVLVTAVVVVHYAVYKQGIGNDYFSRRQNGELFKGKVWPGGRAFHSFSR